MLGALIRWSIQNRFLVLLGTLLLTAWGVHATLSTPLDALPDLSDTQVIIRTEFPGQAPQVVEDQVTYPLTTTMLSVPGARTVRGYSFLAIPTCTSSSTTRPTCIGRARACSNTSIR
jgi:copper/silver efflux system protein